MRVSRETTAGAGAFTAFLALSLWLGMQSPDATIRALGVLAGSGGAAVAGIFAALAAHLAGRPAGYAPIEGDASAWGVGKLEAGELRPRGPGPSRP